MGAGRFQCRALHLRRRPCAIDPCAGDAPHSQCLRSRQPAAGHGHGVVGSTPAGPTGCSVDAPFEERPGAAVNLALRARLNRCCAQAAIIVLSAVLIVWSLVPLYNMVRVALQEKEEVFSSNVIPVAPSLQSFWTVFQESYWLLAKFWGQMENSFWIGIVVASLTLVIGTLTSFTIGRLRIKQGWILTNAALLTYVIPMSFLAIPFYGIMGKYGMTNNPLAVIAVEVTF